MRLGFRERLFEHVLVTDHRKPDNVVPLLVDLVNPRDLHGEDDDHDDRDDRDDVFHWRVVHRSALRSVRRYWLHGMRDLRVTVHVQGVKRLLLAVFVRLGTEFTSSRACRNSGCAAAIL